MQFYTEGEQTDAIGKPEIRGHILKTFELVVIVLWVLHKKLKLF